MPQSWSVIVMCYNEVGNLRKTIERIQPVLAAIAPAGQSEILIVNDGSSDGSKEEIEAILQDPAHSNVRCIHHPQNRGIGNTLITGYENVQFENVTAIPGDGQFDPNELLPYAEVAAHSFVSFYRVENTTYGFSRNALSWFNKTINRLFLSIRLRDVNWVKIYKRDALRQIDFQIRSSLVESEICSKLLISKHQVTEVQSKYLPREHGQSKGASLRIVWMAIRDIMRLVMIILRYRWKKKRVD